jgi:hypothetical protein
MKENSTSYFTGLALTKDLLNWDEYPIIQRELLLGFCFLLGLITIAYSIPMEQKNGDT